MKTKYIFITFLIFIEIISYSQAWKYESGEDAFDGKYKIASIVGTGYEFPYTEPIFAINFFENDRLNIYVSRVGCACCAHLMAYIKFDKNDEIYRMPVFTNSNKDAWFFSYDSLSLNQLINNIKSYTKMFVRLTSDCGQDDFEFSLSGSTIAVNYVITDYFNKIKEIQDEIARLKKFVEEEQKKLEMRLYSDGLLKAKISDCLSKHVYYKEKSSVYSKPKYYKVGGYILRLSEYEEIIFSNCSDTSNYCILYKASYTPLEDTSNIYYVFKSCINIDTVEKIE